MNTADGTYTVTITSNVQNLQTQIDSNAAERYTKSEADSRFALASSVPDVSGFALASSVPDVSGFALASAVHTKSAADEQYYPRSVADATFVKLNSANAGTIVADGFSVVPTAKFAAIDVGGSKPATSNAMTNAMIGATHSCRCDPPEHEHVLDLPNPFDCDGVTHL